MDSDLTIGIVVLAALAFDFTNGFHDTANVVSTTISTRALSPRTAIALAAVMNLVGAFISLAVATTIVESVVRVTDITPMVVFSALVGAIAWNLGTWYAGLPSSSSHALIGGLVGATVAAAGLDAVIGEGVLDQVLIPAVVAPLVAFGAAAMGIAIVYRLVWKLRPGPVNRTFRYGQMVTGSLLALGHGSNDAQKTMGVITLALIANGSLDAADYEVPFWVVVAAAVTIAAGTYVGGWRIIRRRGARIVKLDSAQGFTAQGAGAAVVLAATGAGYPLSTTQVTAGAVIGSGVGRRLSADRWGLAGNIALAWVLTLPGAAVLAGLAFGFTKIFGDGAVGPVLVLIVAALALALLARRDEPALAR